MSYCPNCGAEVDEQANVCESCGVSLAGGQGGHAHQGQQGGQPPQGQQGGRPRGGQQPGQQGGRPRGGQPQGQQGGQPRGGQQGGQPPQGQQRGQQGGQPPQGGPRGAGGAPPGGGDTSRRNLLKYGGGAAVVGIGGFLIWDTFLGGPGDGPAGTSEQFVNALDEGNQERAEELIHSESPMQGGMGFMTGTFEQADVSVDSTEVLEETTVDGQDAATVEVTVTANIAGETQTSTSTVELRKEEGDWKVWQLN